jgi:hypothetical protein
VTRLPGPEATGHRPVAGHLNGRAAGPIGISQGTTVEVADTGEEKPALVQATWKNLVARDAWLRAGAPGLADLVVAVGADSAPARSIAVTTATRLVSVGLKVRRGSPMRAPRCCRVCASRPPDV